MSEQRKLRILQVNKAYYPHIGGIESLVRTFSRELQKRAEVQVLVCQEKGRGEDRIVEGVPVHYASSLGTYFSCPISFSFLRQFRKLLLHELHIVGEGRNENMIEGNKTCKAVERLLQQRSPRSKEIYKLFGQLLTANGP